MSRLVRSVALALLIGALYVPAAAGTAISPRARARSLVNRFFTELERHDVAGLRKFLSPAFEVLRADGSRLTKPAYLRALPAIRTYKLRRLTASADGNVLVTTYEVAANEVVNGKLLHAGYAPRLSVFVKGAQGWRMVAHANFNTPR